MRRDPPAADHAPDGGEEPRWIDVRPVPGEDLFGAGTDDIVGTGMRRPSTRQLVRITVATLALIAGGATVVAIDRAATAAQQRQATQEQRKLTEEERRLTTSRRLLEQADAARVGGDTRSAAMLGLAAVRVHDDDVTRTALVHTTASTTIGASLTGHTGWVWSVAFAPDGLTLATGGWDRTAMLWDLTDRARPTRIGQPLTGHTDMVAAVAFAPDGRTLATASADHTVILWDLAALNDVHREGIVERACAIAGRGLNPREWARYAPGLPYQNTCPSTS